MSFTQAIQSVLIQNYANFNGRARRSEYWWYTLFSVVVNGILQSLGKDSRFFGFIGIVVSLAILVPGLAVSVRRLHDIGKSGWFVLLGLIPLVGAIILIYFGIQDSQPGANQYGENPKYGAQNFGNNYM